MSNTNFSRADLMRAIAEYGHYCYGSGWYASKGNALEAKRNDDKMNEWSTKIEELLSAIPQ